MKQKVKMVVAGALGECVHAAGVTKFLRLAGPEADDPLIDAVTLARAVTCGLLDAPQLRDSNLGAAKSARRSSTAQLWLWMRREKSSKSKNVLRALRRF
ncbi:MAG TPA: hypothetical protein VLE49_20890 [Anaerolineales bacterium]|nr:hypothetical protein [Anaerolineales bacterium]